MMNTASPIIKLRGKDILLLLLYLPGKTSSHDEGILGMTRLTKAMFLFEKEIKKDFKADIEAFPEFMAWRFGPWSEQLTDDIEFFKGIGFVASAPTDQNGGLSVAEEEESERWEEELLDIPKSDTDDFHQPEKIFLTNTGKRFVEANLLTRLSKDQLKILSDFKQKIASLSLFAVLSYVYRKYNKAGEDWTSKSEIKGEILGT